MPLTTSRSRSGARRRSGARTRSPGWPRSHARATTSAPRSRGSSTSRTRRPRNASSEGWAGRGGWAGTGRRGCAGSTLPCPARGRWIPGPGRTCSPGPVGSAPTPAKGWTLAISRGEEAVALLRDVDAGRSTVAGRRVPAPRPRPHATRPARARPGALRRGRRPVRRARRRVEPSGGGLRGRAGGRHPGRPASGPRAPPGVDGALRGDRRGVGGGQRRLRHRAGGRGAWRPGRGGGLHRAGHAVRPPAQPAAGGDPARRAPGEPAAVPGRRRGRGCPPRGGDGPRRVGGLAGQLRRDLHRTSHGAVGRRAGSRRPPRPRPTRWPSTGAPSWCPARRCRSPCSAS